MPGIFPGMVSASYVRKRHGKWLARLQQQGHINIEIENHAAQSDEKQSLCQPQGHNDTRKEDGVDVYPENQNWSDTAGDLRSPSDSA